MREPRGIKGICQSVVIINNPSTIDQNQQLLVRFPNLSDNDVIVPRSARLAFTIELTSKDANATVFQNLGRAISKKTTIRISGNEVMSIDDSDIYHCYVVEIIHRANELGISKKVRENSRECHNHKPQTFPDLKRKRKPTNQHNPNKRTKSTKISSLFSNLGESNMLKQSALVMPLLKTKLFRRHIVTDFAYY